MSLNNDSVQIVANITIFMFMNLLYIIQHTVTRKIRIYSFITLTSCIISSVMNGMLYKYFGSELAAKCSQVYIISSFIIWIFVIMFMLTGNKEKDD